MPNAKELFAHLMTDREFAEIRQCSRRSLQRERGRGDGPAFFKIGQKIFYDANAVNAWLKTKEIQPIAP